MARETGKTEPRHPIQVVARRAGLTPDVLRAWEKRYGVVQPARSPSGRRLYSDADVERLRLIQTAIAGGRRIGQLAALTRGQLAALVEEDRQAEEARASRELAEPSAAAARYLADALITVRQLDGPALRSILGRALMELPSSAFLEQLIAPLLNRIGTLWEDGELSPGHEHLASGVIREELGELIDRLRPRNSAPSLTAAAPASQRHELGAMLAAATAALQGWHVTFLGGDLPVSDIARAAIDTGARAVALSVTYPSNSDQVSQALRELRSALPERVSILVGGRAAPTYRDALRAIGAAELGDLPSLRAVLAVLDSSPHPPPVGS
ncbi:MAG: MerR family transcriptional regulator [Gemmatimonadales bacterium]|nr:MerR family transcriptional regulator [Gemmatimonadales bacterium]NIN12968.1 MerR family transcriptional regulator [Gemmatimonadales bacterium]NIR02643.1 MerR family transcriptional regulator [Gemmatimonadales bacterium]NIS67219.1 MerR family transcriptional regulator [Gemmatimonadales bacterium]